jgi:tetratricopeptide (TPR) repeat protein
LIEAAASDYKAGHFETGLTKLDQQDKAKGPNGASLDLRGSIALEQGKFDLALQAFTEAHKLEPDLFAPRLHLGDLFLREKRYSDARNVYQRLLTETNILISNEHLRYGLLVIALASHEEAAARSALESSKFPTESSAYYFTQAAWEFAHGSDR